MDVAPLLIFGFLIFFLTQFARRVLPVNLTAWQVQALSAVIGIGVTMWCQHSASTATQIDFNGVALKSLDLGSTIQFGLLSTATGAVIPNELIKAIDKFRNTTVVSETVKEK